MKKSLLLTSALCLWSANAVADITNPFYIPERAFLSDTTVSMGKKNFDGSLRSGVASEQYLRDAKTINVTEMLTYGITGTWAVYGGGNYEWLRKSNNGSFDGRQWTIGTKVNTIDEAWRVQIGGDVTRTYYSRWNGVSNPNRKDTNLYVMAGTETSDTVFAYGKFTYQDTNYGFDQGYDNYIMTAAAHIMPAPTYTADVGLTFNFDNITGVKDRDLTFFAAGYKAFGPNKAFGLAFDYVLASKNNIKTAYNPDNQGSFNIAINAKFEF